jgi:hypothetical protein
MNKKIILSTVFVAGALCFHVFANPMMAASRAKEALIKNDGAALSAMVDFEALRADLKSDVEVSLSKEADPMARGFGGAILGGMIDSFVQPSALETAVSQKGMSGFSGAKSTDPEEVVEDYSMSFGLTEFVVSVESNSPAGPVDIVFAPRGLTWKIVGANVDFDKIMNAKM